VKVHIVDGTYELFRQFFARPSHPNSDGVEVAAARAVVRGLLSMLEDGVTHPAVATDHVIESFRNGLYAGYKTGEGIDPQLRRQFEVVERGVRAVGVALFAMVEHEADDAMASVAAVAAADGRVDQVLLCTPDKDLAQCVVGDRVVQLDRRNDKLIDAAGVVDKFGVPPASIPDYLALVGDSADGFPGLPGWGAKSTAAVLARYGHLEDIPPAAGQWDITVRGGAKLARTLADNYDDAVLYRRLAVLATDAPTIANVDELRWAGPSEDLPAVASFLDAPDLVRRAAKLAEGLR
jgi:5'-3' exonuclease